uniref:Uncharacterized protein n=1 Tax=Solanum lycopersicum TaxID=4081 RepID=K4BHN5_SOLLC
MLECTLAYIETIRERYQGKWICGLCAEAVKDDSSTPPPDPTIHFIAAMRQLLRRSLESPKSIKSMPCSPTRNYIWRPCSIIWGKEF